MEVEVQIAMEGMQQQSAVSIVVPIFILLTSLPTTSNPATASAIAESPSVSTSVHSDDLDVPAKCASCSLGTSTICEVQGMYWVNVTSIL